MGKIHKLDQLTADRIAAGEVIEKVGSVVKELVENSLDAGATNIKISLVDSGLKEINVIDNGSGMDYADAKMAVVSHATSKIKTSDDLFSISTLGFRGEALPSIVSVSHFKLKTSTDGVSGIMYSLKAGVILSEALTSSPKGTEITVRDLFFNTPARLQNLSSETNELSYTSDYITKTALARPDVSFTLINNNKTIFQSYGNDDALEVMLAAYGTEVAKEMLSIFNNDGYFKISGFISKPYINRSSKNYISISVNGRIVKSALITNAIIEGYTDLLMSNRYPIVLLKIEADYSLVDVNVHPGKLEIRFSRSDELSSLITQTIRKRLERVELIPGYSGKENARELEEKHSLYEEVKDNLAKDILAEETVDYVAEETTDLDEIASNIGFQEKIVLKVEDLGIDINELDELDEAPTFEQLSYHLTGSDDIFTSSTPLPKMHYIGALFGTYLITQAEDQLFLIDQHAAAERINYEKILKALEQTEYASYDLLVPLKLDYSQAEALLIKESNASLLALGLNLEDFGTGSFMIRNLPTWIPPGSEKEFTEGIINEVIYNKKQARWQFLDDLAKNLACKRSLKANEYRSIIEIEYLLNDLSKAKNPYTCPHGRPVVVKFSKTEIERWFKRV